ncbi:MAG: peptidase [Alphaproteobacteria bacterium]|nr:MAG: peptidase [Alphaproteobacteria bacterium]
MKMTLPKHVLPMTLALAMLAGTHLPDFAHADGRHGEREIEDHDRALSALQKGAILPLPEILGRITSRIEGEIIETELEFEEARPVYEFKYVDRKGRVRELYVDARTGAVLKDKPK